MQGRLVQIKLIAGVDAEGLDNSKKSDLIIDPRGSNMSALRLRHVSRRCYSGSELTEGVL